MRIQREEKRKKQKKYLNAWEFSKINSAHKNTHQESSVNITQEKKIYLINIERARGEKHLAKGNKD